MAAFAELLETANIAFIVRLLCSDHGDPEQVFAKQVQCAQVGRIGLIVPSALIADSYKYRSPREDKMAQGCCYQGNRYVVVDGIVYW